MRPWWQSSQLRKCALCGLDCKPPCPRPVATDRCACGNSIAKKSAELGVRVCRTCDRKASAQ
jgi:hypothetical protein